MWLVVLEQRQAVPLSGSPCWCIVGCCSILHRWGPMVWTLWLVGFGFLLENIPECEWILAVCPYCGSDALKWRLGCHCRLIRWSDRPTDVCSLRLVLETPVSPEASQIYEVWGVGRWQGGVPKGLWSIRVNFMHLTLCLIPVLAIFPLLCYSLWFGASSSVSPGVGVGQVGTQCSAYRPPANHPLLYPHLILCPVGSRYALGIWSSVMWGSS